MRSILEIKWKLRACRVQAGLTQKAVADAVGVKADTVESWESGNSAPTMEQGLALSNLYQIPLGNMDFTKDANKKSSNEGQ